MDANQKVRLLAPLLERLRGDVCAVRTAAGRTRAVATPVLDNLPNLGGVNRVGAYFLRPNDPECRASLIDIDDHDAEVSWLQVFDAAQHINAIMAENEIATRLTRSSGGRGAHLWSFWRPGTSAAAVRSTLTAMLTLAGFTVGTGGIGKKQVEVFPKQDIVPEGGHGNMAWLPGAGESAPIDEIFGDVSTWESEPDFFATLAESTASAPVVSEKISHSSDALPDLATVRSALASIPNTDNYDEFVKIGLAVHSATAGEGLELWQEWAAKIENNDPELNEKKWDTFKPSSISFGTLHHLAMKNSWVPPGTFDATIYPDDTPQLMTLITSGAISPPEWVIKDVLESVAVGILWGEPSTYKSFLAFQWALCVAHGTPWHEHKVAAGPVWIIAGEGRGGVRKRLAAENRRMGRDDDSYGAGVWISSTGSINLSDSSNTRMLIAQGKAAPPKLIIVDTLSRNFQGDENDQGEVRDFIENVTRLGRQLGASVVVVHHAKKDGANYRGSSVLKGNVDFEFETAKLTANCITLTCHKMKEAERCADITLRAQPITLFTYVDQFGDSEQLTSLTLHLLSGAELAAQTSAGQEQTDADILNAIRTAQVGGHLVSKNTVLKMVKRDNHAVQSDISRMLASGVLRTNPGPRGAFNLEIVEK